MKNILVSTYQIVINIVCNLACYLLYNMRYNQLTRVAVIFSNISIYILDFTYSVFSSRVIDYFTQINESFSLLGYNKNVNENIICNPVEFYS